MLTKTQRAAEAYLSSYSRQYWLFQAAGWSALALLSYLSLTLWYNPGQWAPAVHTILQSLLGLLVSHPLRAVASQQWDKPLAQRLAINCLAIIVASSAWTILRLTTFAWLTGEDIPLSDWGGWLFASIIVFGAWAFGYHALKYYRQWNEQLRLTAEAEASFRHSQLRLLKNQLNPHFLFNALNSVSHLVQKEERAAAMQMLARIGDFLRTTLEHDDELMHSVEAELEVLELYLGIEKVRFADRLHVEFDVPAEARGIDIPSLLLQPVLENCIKFAVSKSLAATTIRIEGRIVGERLALEISDTGPPGSRERGAAASTGLGLKNVEHRLRSAYGENFTFDYGRLGERGYHVRVCVPRTRVKQAVAS